MKVRYLLDENLSPRLKLAILRFENNIDILRIGDDGMPSLGTSDPEILQFLASSQRLLVTDNRSTIPDYLDEFYLHGGQSHWGVLWVRPDATIGALAADLHLIWMASNAEEWKNRADWIPF